MVTRGSARPANVREVIGRNKGIMTPSGMQGVWLDTPLIDMIHGPGTVRHFYQHLCHRFEKYGIDFSTEPVLVYPAEHYQNGGVITDDRGRSNVPHLYVAGEVAGGVHGRNRLGGNSLTDLFVFGRRAGIQAGAVYKEITGGKPSLAHLTRYHQELKKAGIKDERASPVLLPDYRYEKSFPIFQQ